MSDLDPLSPSLFAADGVVELPPVDDPGYGEAVADGLPRGRASAPCCRSPTSTRWCSPRRPTPIRAAGALVFLPTPEVALGCQDKWACHVMLGRAGPALAAHLAARRRRPGATCPTRCC